MKNTHISFRSKSTWDQKKSLPSSGSFEGPSEKLISDKDGGLIRGVLLKPEIKELLDEPGAPRSSSTRSFSWSELKITDFFKVHFL